MSLSRSVFNSALRPFVRAPLSSRLPISAQRFASQDYGSGSGDPVGENPQDQGANPSADLEHPGPPPPKVGQNTGSTPTKGTSSGHNTEEPAQGKSQADVSTGNTGSDSLKSSNGKRGFHTSARQLNDELRSKKTQGAQPKILNESPPENPSEDVKKHNADMEQRAEQATEKVSDEDAQKDKVGKGFWSGHGGADRQP